MQERFAAARVARLATVTAGGRPHVVPVCFVLAGDVIYSAVDAKPKSTSALRRLDNVRANPRVSLLVDHYADDWSQLWWIRVDGEARIVDDDAAIELLAAKYEQYRVARPPGPVLAIAELQWRQWSASLPPDLPAL
jgi:PPOX class probable F420-dependent enzyme